MASRLQDVIARGLAAAKPLATLVAPGTLYYSTDTAVTERSNGTIWESYSDAGSGLVSAHAITHFSAGSDPVNVTALAGYPGTTTTFLRGDASFVPIAAVAAPPVHGNGHKAGGADPVSVLDLAGFPGTTNVFLRGDGVFAAIPARTGWFNFVIDGGASPITTGLKGYLVFPACTILIVDLLADVVGSVVLDLWKAAYAAYPPTVANTITAAAKPTISAAIKSQNTTLVGWTVVMADGDILAINVDSAATIKKLTLGIKIQAA